VTLEDVCFAVCTALDAVGTTAVLTGGSAATYYAPSVYQSMDADFVIVFGNSELGVQALHRIGFAESGGIYRSDWSPYVLEFPVGPLMIGREHIADFATVRRGRETLHVLHPTDCVRDRLLWYFHYGDFSALGAAVGVAAGHEVDMEGIRDWSERERAIAKFELFNREIARAEGHGSKTAHLPLA